MWWAWIPLDPIAWWVQIQLGGGLRLLWIPWPGGPGSSWVVGPDPSRSVGVVCPDPVGWASWIPQDPFAWWVQIPWGGGSWFFWIPLHGGPGSLWTPPDVGIRFFQVVALDPSGFPCVGALESPGSPHSGPESPWILFQQPRISWCIWVPSQQPQSPLSRHGGSRGSGWDCAPRHCLLRGQPARQGAGKPGGSEICPDFSRAGLCLPASGHLPSEVTSPRAELCRPWRAPRAATVKLKWRCFAHGLADSWYVLGCGAAPAKRMQPLGLGPGAPVTLLTKSHLRGPLLSLFFILTRVTYMLFFGIAER